MKELVSEELSDFHTAELVWLVAAFRQSHGLDEHEVRESAVSPGGSTPSQTGS